MAIINFEDLPKYRKRFGGKKIVYCSGVFDLTHPGHVLFLEEAKKFGEILFVGVGNDATIRNYKRGMRPILNERMRIKMVDSLKPVDYCYLDKGGFDPNDNLALNRASLEQLKPDIYVVNDDGYGLEERKALSKRYPVKVIILKRECPKEFEGVSTTKIIEKILSDSKAVSFSRPSP